MFAGEAKGKYGKMKCEGVNTSSSSESVVAAITTSNSSREGFQRDNFDVVRFNSCKLLGPKTPHFIKLEIALKKCSDCIARTRIRSASCLSTTISTIRFVVCSFLIRRLAGIWSSPLFIRLRTHVIMHSLNNPTIPFLPSHDRFICASLIGHGSQSCLTTSVMPSSSC